MQNVEVWHDTTMWNEGFEQALDPLITVNVFTEEEALELMEWVRLNHSLEASLDYIGFRTRRGWADPSLPTYNLALAQRAINEAIANWGGL